MITLDEESFNKRFDYFERTLAFIFIAIRRKRHLSQEDLAKELKIPRSTIQLIERGEGNPSFTVLLRLRELECVDSARLDAILRGSVILAI